MEGLADAVATDDRAAAEGVGAIVAAIVELLGRLVGDDMAVSLLEQAVPASPPGEATPIEESQP